MAVTRKIIDIHSHIFPEKIAYRAIENLINYYGLTNQKDGTPKGLLEGANDFTDIRFVVSSAATKPENVKAGNDYLLECAKKDKRFVAMSSFHPLMETENALIELTRVKKLGSKGIKLHPDMQHFAVDDDRAIEIYKICAKLKLPILFHVGDKRSDLSHPKRILNVLDKVPDLTVIAAHMGGYTIWDEAEKYLIGQPVYLDTSEALIGMSPEKLYSLIEKHGTDRVMFGSDYPLWTTKYAFDGIERCRMTEEEKDLVYFKTAEKVFGL